MPDSIYLQYFAYATPLLAVPAVAGGAIAGTINVAADADFEVQYITIGVLQANVAVLNWGGLIQITDSGVGRTFFNIPILVDGVRGQGTLPYPINPPRICRRNSTITVDLTNSPAGVATDVMVVLHGHKQFAGQASQTTQSGGS